MLMIFGQVGMFVGCISGCVDVVDDLVLVDVIVLYGDLFLVYLVKGYYDLYCNVDEEEVVQCFSCKVMCEIWVIFQFECLMGLCIEQLCEVIDDDFILMCLFGVLVYVCGVFNLCQ